eukprot:TRINITY_DN3673_c0_g5_i1.p1 TRINITY_DN3673_c0_g5~~TRINITY_DN3673_c0_g5_i1.p1  ORF type:complete len:634 (-),score=92.64 TRINITY_DN3673_c0_g5_i1:40-1941(-)
MASLKYDKLQHGQQGKKHNGTKGMSIDLLFFKRLYRVIKFISQRDALIITSIIVIVTAIQAYVVSKTGGVIGDFYMLIIEKDIPQYRTVLIRSLVIVILSGLLDSTIKMLVELLSWCWRKILCTKVHSLYFNKNLYYKLNALGLGEIDNPDQRITTDMDNFTTTLALITSSLINGALIIIYYFFTTWKTVGWYAPCIIFAYFLVSSIVSKFAMGPVVPLIYLQEQLEGDFRIGHVRVRDFSEAIALLYGDPREEVGARERLKALLDNKLKLLKFHWCLNSTTNTFVYIGSILNYIVVALPIFFVKDVNFSASYVSSASFECIMLVSGFSTIMNLGKNIGDLGGYTARISRLFEVAQENETQKIEGSSDSQVVVIENAPSIPLSDLRDKNTKNGKIVDGETIKFSNVTCYTPNGHCILTNLSFEVVPGKNILLTGPVGCGKSSVCKILKGIWPYFSGTVTKPIENKDSFHHSRILYQPQQTYLVQGSLKDQILYPFDESTHPLSDSSLFDLLSIMKLEYLIKMSIDENDKVVTNWSEFLSPGEQQGLVICRIFYHRPKYAVLDEITSSLSPDLEKIAYQKLMELGVTFLSVGHRTSLFEYHHTVFQFFPSENSNHSERDSPFEWRLIENLNIGQ